MALSGKIIIILTIFGMVTSLMASNIGCRRPCTRHWRPFCGTDGVTYPNRCELNNAICADSCLMIGYHGECMETTERAQISCPHVCPRVEQYWCAHDGNTYRNLCELETANKRKPHDSITPRHPGRCTRGSPIIT